jgi:hypothetical protein
MHSFYSRYLWQITLFLPRESYLFLFESLWNMVRNEYKYAEYVVCSYLIPLLTSTISCTPLQSGLFQPISHLLGTMQLAGAGLLSLVFLARGVLGYTWPYVCCAGLYDPDPALELQACWKGATVQCVRIFFEY